MKNESRQTSCFFEYCFSTKYFYGQVERVSSKSVSILSLRYSIQNEMSDVPLVSHNFGYDGFSFFKNSF